MGAESCFDVSEGDIAVEAGECGSEDGGGVALREDDIGFFVGECGVELDEESGGEFRERLVGLHDVQVNVGVDIEEMEHLVDEAAVLGGEEDAGAGGGVSLEGLDDGGHFDEFRAGADAAEDVFEG